MRTLLILPLLILASPALAQTAPVRAPDASALPQQLLDPKMPETLGRVASALTRAILALPIGDVQAAIEGRPASTADRRRTIGSEMLRGQPQLDHDVQRQVASGAASAQATARAIQRALPAINQALAQATTGIDRATANLPSRDYPRR